MPLGTRRWAGACLLSLALLIPVPAAAAGSSSTANIPALVDTYARKYGIPLQIARNLVRVESGGRQDAVSSSGARGVMQLMPATARALGVDIDDTTQNIEGGMRYLRMQFDRFGRWDLAVAAYHAGPVAVQKANGIPAKSAAFVRRVMGGTAVASVPPARAAEATHRLTGGFAWPVEGLLTARFGTRHRGIDLAAPAGTPIRASRAGTVSHTGRYYEYGQTVILEHGGEVSTLYGHTSAILVQKGQAIKAGQVIARVGCTGRCTGPHVHFEIRVNGRAVDPLTAQAGTKTPKAAASSSSAASARVTQATPIQTPAAPTEDRSPRTPSASGDTIVSVREVMRGGEVVYRVETTTLILEGDMRVRITREYRRVNGDLVLVSEQSRVYRVGEEGEED